MKSIPYFQHSKTVGKANESIMEKSLRIQEGFNTGEALIPATPHITISQAIRYFSGTLTKPGNYPRIVRAYLTFCLEHRYGIDLVSLKLYGAGLAASRISPIRKFMMWYQLQGQPTIVADPPRNHRSIPAANELILGFLADADRLQGDDSRLTYTKALNNYFTYIQEQRQTGLEAGFGARSVRTYLQELNRRAVSVFTYNLYLSCIKQLASWVIKTKEHHKLTVDQLHELHEISTIRGRLIEKGYHKDSLMAPERLQLLDTIEDPADRAMVALMAWGGLRTVELVRLQIRDVDLRQKLLWVLGKGKATRKDIRLPAVCAQVLSQYMQGITPTPLNSTRFLFEGLTTRSVRYRVRKYLTNSGLIRERLSAHSLRHTAAQRLLDEGVEPVHVQRHLRHEHFETTLAYVRKKTDESYYKQID